MIPISKKQFENPRDGMKICPVCQSVLRDGVCLNCEETWNQEYCEEL